MIVSPLPRLRCLYVLACAILLLTGWMSGAPTKAMAATPGATQAEKADTASASAKPDDRAVILRPVEMPDITPTPARDLADEPDPGATSMVIDSIGGVANVPFVTLPGTAVPIWWLGLVVLAIPLTMLWTGWARATFEPDYESDDVHFR